MANNPVQGFPDVWGKHSVTVVEHNGPASYVTGGETASLKTPAFGGSTTVGTRGFAYVAGGADYSATYRVDPVYSSANTPNAGIRNAVTLKWTVIATGAEVANATNLSAFTVRLLVVGG